jgi:hypothetical protein
MDLASWNQSLEEIRYLLFITLYIGPETMLPLVSALAAIGGVLLMFWQRFVSIVRRLWRVVLRREKD